MSVFCVSCFMSLVDFFVDDKPIPSLLIKQIMEASHYLFWPMLPDCSLCPPCPQPLSLSVPLTHSVSSVWLFPSDVLPHSLHASVNVSLTNLPLVSAFPIFTHEQKYAPILRLPHISHYSPVCPVTLWSVWWKHSHRFSSPFTQCAVQMWEHPTA